MLRRKRTSGRGNTGRGAVRTFINVYNIYYGMSIEVVKHPNSIDMTIDEFILWYLDQPVHQTAYVHQMLDAFNTNRLKSNKRLMKYSSFRTIVCNLATEGCIVFDHEEDSGHGFPRAYYRTTGKEHNKGWKRK